MEELRPILRKYVDKLLKELPLLDLGCGEGKDALLLAKQGFVVEVVDKDASLLEEIEKKAADVQLTTKESDIRSFDFTKSYGAIISLHVLHFLRKEEREVLLKKMKEATTSKGFHFLAVFTVTGDLQSEKLHLFEHGQLKQYYTDWNVLSYVEAMRPTREKDNEGKKKKHEVAFLVAQKP